MKLIELNIGLESKTLGKLNPCEVLNSLTARGFECLKYRLVESESKDGPETCLAWKGTPPSDWQAQIADLSNKLGQDCIAVVCFIGHDPYDAFIPHCWKTPHRFCIEYSEDGETWHLQKLPFKISPLYYNDERAAEDEIARYNVLRSNTAKQYLYRVVPEA